MYRIFFAALLITFFAACSAPQPKTPPAWYTSLPQDCNYFYAVGVADEETTGYKKALNALRHTLEKEASQSFKQDQHKLALLRHNEELELLQNIQHITRTLSLRSAILESSQTYNNSVIVLVKIARKDIFDALQTRSQHRFQTLQKGYQALEGKNALEQYSQLTTLMKEYYPLASYAQLQSLSLCSDNTDKHFALLQKIKENSMRLQKDISVYVLSDANSLPFLRTIKDALRAQGLTVSKKPKTKEALTLLITSSTQQSLDYEFMQSKSLLELQIYDKAKNKLASKQHTLVGRSKKSYLDAKMQSAKSLQAIIRTNGIFNTLGINTAK